VHKSVSFSQNVGMNKRDLAKSVAVQSDVDLKTVAAVLDGFTDVVTAVVSKGEPVSIPGFAKFVKVDRAARMGRNPATGETIRIKASKKARITPVKAFKDAVLAPATAPKLNKGAWPIDAAAVAAAGKSAAVAPVRATVAKAPAKKAPVARKAPAAKKIVRKAAATAKKAPAAKKIVRKAAATARKAPVAKKVVRRAAPVRKAVKKAR
jgi:DNA-binding protein HU-beta